MGNRHHCRYCGQIFSDGVCKKSARIPSEGYSSSAVRVCDTCYDQIERGDPVCLSKCVARMRSGSSRDKEDAAKELGNWASMDPNFSLPPLVAACEALQLPRAIGKLLDSSSPSATAAGAGLLAAMMQYPEYADALDGPKLLSPLLSSIASKGAKADLRQGGDRPLEPVVELRGASRCGRRAASARSWRSSSRREPPNPRGRVRRPRQPVRRRRRRLARARAGGPSSPSGLPVDVNAGLQGLLTLLALLCAHNECRDQAADANCVQPLVRLLASPKAHVQRALAVCQQLAGSRRSSAALLEAGGASPLASLLATSAASDVEVAIAALESVECLRAGATQQAAVRNAGAVPHLIQLMNHEQPRVSQLASGLVAELCPGDVHSAEQLYESGGLVMLSDQLRSGDVRAQAQALSALSQLSAHPQQAGAIVDNGCVPSLLDLLDHPSQELKSYAAITFGNLCSMGAIPQHQLQHPSVLPHLVNVLTSSNGLAKGPAAGAIASMCSRPELRRTVFELGGLPGLVALLSGESDTSYHAVQAVAQFAADEAFRVSLAETGALGGSRRCSPRSRTCSSAALRDRQRLLRAVAVAPARGARARSRQLGQMLFSARRGGRGWCSPPSPTCSRARRADARAGRRPRRRCSRLSAAPETQTQAAMAIGHM